MSISDLLSKTKSVWSCYGCAIIVSFFVLFIGIGLLASRDYGVSWDEPNMFYLGQEVYNYALGNGSYTTEPGRRLHGPVVEWSLAALQNGLQLSDLRDIVLMHHTVTFLLFFVGVACFFFLARKSLGSAALALFGCVMLVLSPRIFAHSFYNSRDIPNLSFFIFGITSLLWYLDRRTIERAIVHGMICALAMSLRATGVFLPTITIMLLVYQLLLERREHAIHWDREAMVFLLFLTEWAGMTFLLWPLLWTNPLRNFLDAVITTSHFRGVPPWYYIPRWIVISTPFLYTCFFLFGTGVFLRNITKSVRTRSLSFPRDSLAFWCWLLVPIISIIITHSSVYDDWRHVFFLYPAFILIALEGVQLLWRTITQRRFWLAGAFFACWTVGSLTMTTIWIFQNHPLEAVYFSIPTSWVDPKTFGLDYWGLSYRQAFDWVLANDNRPVLRISPTSSPGFFTMSIFTPQQRGRIQLTEEKDADYILDNFSRDHFDKIYSGKFAEVHTVLVSGIPVLTIYDRRKPLTESCQ